MSFQVNWDDSCASCSSIAWTDKCTSSWNWPNEVFMKSDSCTDVYWEGNGANSVIYSEREICGGCAQMDPIN